MFCTTVWIETVVVLKCCVDLANLSYLANKSFFNLSIHVSFQMGISIKHLVKSSIYRIKECSWNRQYNTIQSMWYSAIKSIEQTKLTWRFWIASLNCFEYACQSNEKDEMPEIHFVNNLRGKLFSATDLWRCWRAVWSLEFPSDWYFRPTTLREEQSYKRLVKINWF